MPLVLSVRWFDKDQKVIEEDEPEEAGLVYRIPEGAVFWAIAPSIE